MIQSYTEDSDYNYSHCLQCSSESYANIQFGSISFFMSLLTNFQYVTFHQQLQLVNFQSHISLVFHSILLSSPHSFSLVYQLECQLRCCRLSWEALIHFLNYMQLAREKTQRLMQLQFSFSFSCKLQMFTVGYFSLLQKMFMNKDFQGLFN